MSGINWHRQHRWSGIVASIMLLAFCISGVLLNHRDFISDYEVGRKWLPSGYEFRGWNGGLMRGTATWGDKILIYGVNGVWTTDSAASVVSDFNDGLPEAADHRQVRGMAQRGGILYAATPEALYELTGLGWRSMDVPKDEEERLSDITARNDSLIVVGRSNLYVSSGLGHPFEKITLQAGDDHTGKVTLFRTVWMLHSGELFGTAGKIVVDFIAVILILLCITGLVVWLLPKRIRRIARRRGSVVRNARYLKFFSRIHGKIGGMTIVLTLLIAFTGWCLRPPVMIPLAITKTKPVPATTLDSDNPWHDKLRMTRFDSDTGEWLISSSEGFYSLRGLHEVPQRITSAPPVSVMGLNVWERDSAGKWVCGSFSGMFRWDRGKGVATDYFTGEVQKDVSGPPFGKYAASGYSKEFNAVVEYYDGTEVIPQPEELRRLPMSLWNVALEAHSGRLFIGVIATYIFIFICGFVVIWCLWSGWKIHRHDK